MSFLQDFRDLQGIRAGMAKAERDIALTKNHIVAHNMLHQLDTSNIWDCNDYNKNFFAALGLDVEHDTPEAVGYKRGREKYQDELVKEAMKSDPSELTIITIETNGDETQEELVARAHQAIREHDIFQEQVSETDQQNPDQKESK